MVKHEAGYNYVRPGRFRTYTDLFLPVAVFGGALVLYLQTLAPSVFWGDSAAFAASNFILGLAHSPSFPLYTLLGRLFDLIPNLTPAFAANLMSAFFASLSVSLFFILIKQFAEAPLLQSRSNKIFLGGKKIDFGSDDIIADSVLVEADSVSRPASVIITCLAATVLFAISLPVWLSAVRAEVYSLHLFLSLTATLVLFRAISGKKRNLFFLGIWIYALSFANHPLLALAFAPAFLYLIILGLRDFGFRPAILGIILLFFVASFSVYLYLPIRSGQEPAINWGRPGTLDSFLSAITRSSDLANLSQITVAPDYMARLRKLGIFSAAQIGWPLIALTIFGFWGIFKISRKLFLFFPLAIFANLAIILWAADFTPRNYDLLNYLAPLFSIILITSIAGVTYLIRHRIAALQTSVGMAVLIGVFIYLSADRNYARANLSTVDGPETIAQEAVKNIPPKSIIIAAEDDFLLPLWYAAYADSSARDIRIVSAGGMVNAKYRKQLTLNYPDMSFPPDFTNDAPGHADSLTAQLCRLNNLNHDIFVQFGAPGIEAGALEPAGILFKYIPEGKQAVVDKESYKVHLACMENMVNRNPYENITREFAARWLFNTAVYFDRHNTPEIAWQLFNKALVIDKENIDMRIRLAAASLAPEN